jgi:uncharacterized protein involved in exopolysaccharide biosynthesis
MFRRRRRFFLIPALLIPLLSIVGAFLLPNRYESSTTILSKKDEILNPLLAYDIANAVANEDQLKTYNEILYSQIVIDRIIDSLYSGEKLDTREQRQDLTALIRKNIWISRSGTDAFFLTYTESDSLLAKKGCELAASLFIETTLKIEGQRNFNTVEFYEKKLSEIKDKFEASRKEVVSHLREETTLLSDQTKTLYSTQIDNLEKQISDLDDKVKTYQTKLVVLRTFPDAMRDASKKQSLYDLSREDLPFAPELRKLLERYDDLLQHYTGKYPEVQKLEAQILDLLGRMHNALDVELTKQEKQRTVLEDRRTQIIEEIRKSSISQRMDEDKESDYSIYRKLYDDMKLKLEQAQAARDLGNQASQRFMVLSPAVVPAKPSKPNRPQLILGGLALGLFAGFMAMTLREMFDSTIRVPLDVAVYQKPVIAFITDGNNGSRN